jgi:two-component system OmpR family sensor kinase
MIEQYRTLRQDLALERRVMAQQRECVSMTCHEFRTLLTSIDAHAQRLIKMSDRLEPRDIAERGTRIRGAVQKITSIMDALLGASGLPDGPFTFRPAALDPRMLLRDVCQVHRETAHGVLINEDFLLLPATVSGDATLLFHAVSNLISNAVKYSPQGSPVEVLARQEMGFLVVQVRDQGIGIPSCDRERLFERYFRGSNVRGIPGTGVGLLLVATVAALHQGEVFVESIEGVGSTFVLRFPVSESAVTAQVVSHTRANDDLHSSIVEQGLMSLGDARLTCVQEKKIRPMGGP